MAEGHKAGGEPGGSDGKPDGYLSRLAAEIRGFRQEGKDKAAARVAERRAELASFPKDFVFTAGTVALNVHDPAAVDPNYFVSSDAGSYDLKLPRWVPVRRSIAIENTSAYGSPSATASRRLFVPGPIRKVRLRSGEVDLVLRRRFYWQWQVTDPNGKVLADLSGRDGEPIWYDRSLDLPTATLVVWLARSRLMAWHFSWLERIVLYTVIVILEGL